MTKEKKHCAWCRQFKEVYAYQERDYEEVKGTLKRDLLIENPNLPLKDDDVVGVPMCKECYLELYGEN